MRKDDDIVIEARKMYERTGSFKETAAALGLSQSAVRDWALHGDPDGTPWPGYRPRPHGKARHGGNAL